MSFLGAWLVSEYVYNSDGSFAGVIQQRRELERLANGRVCVNQESQPEPGLADHAMGSFAGTHVFEIEVDGPVRRYLGPAVVGSGLSLGDGAMIGRGVWPNFGHNFRSYPVMAQPQRQLTGSKFFTATEMVANIAGVAVPERESGNYSKLSSAAVAYDLAPIWHGSCAAYAAGGDLMQEHSCERRYTANGRWRDIILVTRFAMTEIGNPFRGHLDLLGIPGLL